MDKSSNSTKDRTKKKYDIKHIITIQKYIRGFLVRKHILIPPAFYQTKHWRKNMKWYKNGKSNKCETYQNSLIEKILNTKPSKTNDRINMETLEIKDNKNPMTRNDGFEWSENFDGKFVKKKNTFYFNLKFVCDKGGAQTRTLREAYHFIKCQIKYLYKSGDKYTYFINILDGDTCFHNMNKFTYLIEKYKPDTKYIFIGSLHDFQKSKFLQDMHII